MVSVTPGGAPARPSIFNCSLVALVLLATGVAAPEGYTTKVATRFGQVRGLWSRSTRGRLVAHYLGLPYAQPPLGDLRFRSPQPWNTTWPNIFEATQNSPMCIQLNKYGHTRGSEDCLYLNIFVPMISTPQKEKNALIPVMVYVHGGRFQDGSSNSRELPPDYLMDQDVILVTVNYRLNILGFLGTGSRVSPGNYGLKDIAMALRWVQENIGSFRGDRNAVTLWGHSAGAVAVHALALTEKSEGLFNRYILQSGSALCSWALNAHRWGRSAALRTAAVVDCLPRQSARPAADTGATTAPQEATAEPRETTAPPETTTQREESDTLAGDYDEKQEEEMMRCLRNADAEKIANAVNYFQDVWRGNPCCIFGPMIETESEDAIVTRHPITAMKNRLFRDIPFIMGVVEDEGLAKTVALMMNASAKTELINNFESYMPSLLEYHQLTTNVTEFLDAVEEFYFAGNVSANLEQNITEAVSDSLFLWPAYKTLKYQSELMNSSTYFYLFAYEGTFTSTFSTGSPLHYGISHADDLNYLIPLLNKKHGDQMLHNTESDVTMINIMTEMWASFAADGVPRAWRMPAWPSYKNNHEFLRFGVGKHPELTTETEFFPGRMNFWEELTTNVTGSIADEDPIARSLIEIAEPVNADVSRFPSCISLACLIALITCAW